MYIHKYIHTYIHHIHTSCKGGPLGALSHEVKFKQDAIYQVFYSVRTQYTVWVV